MGKDGDLGFVMQIRTGHLPHPLGLDLSPPRKRRQDVDTDLSPPRKSRKDVDGDLSPPRNKKKVTPHPRKDQAKVSLISG
ncbi:hypothetical protein FF1_033344 [Malus domestica]